MSAHLNGQPEHTLPFELYTAALIPEDRARLHENIALRFHLMLEQGFIGEVENLRRRYPGLTADSPPSAASATVRRGNTSTVQPTDKPSSKKALPPRANLPNAN